ncbi:hypothetical protein [Duganella sp. Root198D2]|uniref:hypothetical protein n=1 Tax=Duganella sp. Root198D2 TaxID=1736489 RepID=UPI0007098552|nr:hypothetical protein [Duganella sp. Root198D2]KRC02740.1 hypothetical protein ASE26_16110 [Duganella sp. Root198D2]
MKMKLAALAFLASCTAASAQSPIAAIEGEYKLTSSTAVPASKWGFTKAHISIRKLDEQHVVILLSCEWKDEPKAKCDNYYFAKWRDDSLYLQDMNTDGFFRMYFDPAARIFTVIWRGSDRKGSIRRDVYGPANGAPEDAALIRRLKRAEKSYVDPDNVRAFGTHDKWTYDANRIEFQNSTP